MKVQFSSIRLSNFYNQRKNSFLNVWHNCNDIEIDNYKTQSRVQIHLKLTQNGFPNDLQPSQNTE